ncbi:hypothetical protein [Arthrobacter antibioticus]|nr:hypothetical protein [Arthrobacter sp. H35-MC1]MDJ0317856.1 hypothetical protein [Arthrobacter sp. H35-MC1]
MTENRATDAGRQIYLQQHGKAPEPLEPVTPDPGTTDAGRAIYQTKNNR